MTVSLKPEVEELIARQIAKGRFDSASEVVAAGLRLLAQTESWDDKALEVQLLQGIDSGPAQEMTEADWAEIGKRSATE